MTLRLQRSTTVARRLKVALRLSIRDGKPAGECPLKHTEVKAQVSGFLSRVTVTQDFENNFQTRSKRSTSFHSRKPPLSMI